MRKPVDQSKTPCIADDQHKPHDSSLSLTRRRLLAGGAAAAVGGATAASGFPYISRARAADKPLSGTTLNVSCWSAPYPKYLADYIPEFEHATGAKASYETPSFPIYNQLSLIHISEPTRQAEISYAVF